MKLYYLSMSIFCFFLASCQEEPMEESVSSLTSEVKSNTLDRIDPNQPTIWGVGSQETVGEDGRAVNAVDGDPNTWWHTQYTGSYSWDRWVSIGLRYPTIRTVNAISITHRPKVITGRPIMFSVEVQKSNGQWIQIYLKPWIVSPMLDMFEEGPQTFYFANTWPGTDYRVTFYQTVNDTRYTYVSEIKLFDSNNPGDGPTGGNKPVEGNSIVKTVSSEETVGEDGRAVNAVDGNPNTWWHTQYTGNYPWSNKASISFKYPTPSKFTGISITHRPNVITGRPLWFYVEFLYEDGNWVKEYMKPSWASSWASSQLLDVNREGEQIYTFNHSWPATDYRVTFEQTMDNTRYTYVSEIKFF